MDVGCGLSRGRSILRRISSDKPFAECDVTSSIIPISTVGGALL